MKKKNGKFSQELMNTDEEIHKGTNIYVYNPLNIHSSTTECFHNTLVVISLYHK